LGKILLVGFEVEDKLFRIEQILRKHPILHNLCPKQKVLYRNFIPVALLGFKATYYHGGLTSREKIKHAALDGR
jgi:ATP-dependent DNA helicase RecQ